MKKIIYSSIVLTFFSLSIILFQLVVGCQKEATAKGTSTQTQNKFVYSFLGTTGWQYWIANNDGTSQKQIQIVLPGGLKPTGEGRLTQDGTTLIFPTVDGTTGAQSFIYSVSLDGTNLKNVFSSSGAQQINVNSTF